MKFWIWSDLHMETGGSVTIPPRPDNVDAILIAGDLDYARRIEETAKFYIDHYDLPIIFVAGNHEFYYQDSMPQAISAMEIASLRSEAEGWKQRFYFLNRDTIILGDTRIIGATLWVDFDLGAETREDKIWRLQEAVLALNDFRTIRYREGKVFRPGDMLELFYADQAYIREQLLIPFDGKTVVLTHHMPHPDCTPAVYADDKHNYLFASSEKPFGQHLASDYAPDLWICGHTHHAFDIQIGNTRVVCNPHGYGRENGRNSFVWDKVVDTDDLAPKPSGVKP